MIPGKEKREFERRSRKEKLRKRTVFEGSDIFRPLKHKYIFSVCNDIILYGVRMHKSVLSIAFDAFFPGQTRKLGSFVRESFVEGDRSLLSGNV